MKGFTGLGTALVTPFKEQNGDVDWEKFEELVAFQANNGVDFLVPCGTTGESPTMTHNEHKKIMAMAVTAVKGVANGKVKILAGTGSNSTAEAVDLTPDLYLH